jgi:hypothetical protein
MVMAVTARGVGPEVVVDPRSGRAQMLVVLDAVTGTVRALDNRATSKSGQGAGPEVQPHW